MITKNTVKFWLKWVSRMQLHITAKQKIREAVFRFCCFLLHLLDFGWCRKMV